MAARRSLSTVTEVINDSHSAGLCACRSAHSDEPWRDVQPETLVMNEPVQRIVITDVRIPFFRLVFFLIKATLAVIPVALFYFVLSALITAVDRMSGGALWALLRLIQ